MADRFHTDSPPAPGPLTLRGPEAHHLAVSRVRPGDRVVLFSGDGREHPATVVEVGRRDVTLDVGEAMSVSRESPRRVVALVALPKGDRGTFLVEKLTELGASELIVIETRRTVVHAGEAKLDKLHRHVIEASKQCGRNVLMSVSGPRPWADAIRDGSLPAVRYVAHVGETGTIQVGDAAFAVGPEGGFTDEEIAAAVAVGWAAVGLGPRILRVETAALALAARLA